MQPDDSVAQLIEKIKAGDEETAHALWDRYFPQLVRLAHGKLADRDTRMADEEDVALSVLDSFIRAAASDHFPDLRDRNSLWRLLSVMTFRKVVDRIRHEQRQKRGGGKVRGESALFGTQASEHRGIDQIVGREPTPAFAAELTEEFRLLLDRLGDETLRRVAVLKMQGYANQEIAAEVGCALRSVERKLSGIRKIWSSQGGER